MIRLPPPVTTGLPLVAAQMADAPAGPLLVAGAQHAGVGRATPWHRHARGQLLGATQGLLALETGQGKWVVPANGAIWIPPGMPHGLQSHGPFAGWSVYVRPDACLGLPAQVGMFRASGLLREAILRAAQWSLPAGPESVLDAVQQRLAAVILDEMAGLPAAPLGLPMPQQAPLLNIARALLAQPGDERSMAQWAQWAGIAPRSLTRHFTRETGYSFAAWRQRLRLLCALEMLAAGRGVTAIASELGYASTSTFIAVFKRSFGTTPGRYLEAVST
ncbi:MAG: HTH-type transcriptional regulator NimR [Kerstersia gyiorum]